MTTVAELIHQLNQQAEAGHGLCPVVLIVADTSVGSAFGGVESSQDAALAVEFNDDDGDCVVIEA